MGHRRSRAGFTLIELMIVVAILGILSAVALPAYSRYIRQSKIRVLKYNAETAVGLVRDEMYKRNAGSPDYLDTPAEFAAELNSGGKKSVYDPSLDAFATSGTGKGTVVITKNISVVPNTYQVSPIDGNGNPMSGYTVTVVVE